MADTIQVIRVERVASGEIDDGDFVSGDGEDFMVYQVVGDVIELSERRRVVAGQDDDGSLNGNDYPETRLETEWKPVSDAAR